MQRLKKIFLLLVVVVLYSIVTGAQAKEPSDAALQAQIKSIQLACQKCSNLHDITCVKDKITGYYNLDQYLRNKYKLSITDPNIAAIIKQVDISNTDNLKDILQIHGWPIISKFGKNTDHEAWMLVQHADHDPHFQASIAFMLEQLVAIGETDQKNFAYLYDRVAVGLNHIGIKQKYGTQSMLDNNTIKLTPFVGTIQELDSRRQAIGLPPIQEYLAQLREFYQLEVAPIAPK